LDAEIVKPLVRQVQNENAVLVIDDSISHKPHTDPSELIGWHYDHTTGTSVGCSCSVKGINFLTTLYCVGDVSLPVAFALVEKDEEFTDKKTGKPKRRASISKNEHYRTMLKTCVKNEMSFRYALKDVWFAAAENMKLIKTEIKTEMSLFQSKTRKTVAFKQSKHSHSNTAKHRKSSWNKSAFHCFWSNRSLRTKTAARAFCIW
jgi:hypothetical protein